LETVTTEGAALAAPNAAAISSDAEPKTRWMGLLMAGAMISDGERQIYDDRTGAVNFRRKVP
jgi:hypothetical protein